MADPQGGEGTAQRLVLLIDEDEKVGRQVRLSLHQPRCQVLTCTHHREGLRLAASRKPHLILLETRFTETDGFRLAQDLLQSPETRSSAVAFFTSDDSVCQRFRGIQLGAVDYIVKPVEGRKLAARLESLFARLDRTPSPLGPVSGPSVNQIFSRLQEIEQDASSGVLELYRIGQAACIHFSFGEVQRAECNALLEEAALNEIAAHGDWQLSFVEKAALPVSSVGESTIASAPGHSLTANVAEGEMAAANRRHTKVTPLAIPKAAKHLPSSMVTTVLDEAISRPRPHSTNRLQSEGRSSPAEPENPEDPAVTKAETVQPSFPQSTASPSPSSGAEAQGVPSRPSGNMSDSALDKKPNPVEGPPVEEYQASDEYEEDAPTTMDFALEDKVGDLDFSGFRPSIEGGKAAAAFFAKNETPGFGFTAIEQSASSLSETIPKSGGTSHLAESLGSHDFFQHWLRTVNKSPLLLVVPQLEIRNMLQQATEKLGYSVLPCSTSNEAYLTALQRRPVAILSYLKGLEMDNRELLAAVRGDFHLRETPFIMLSSEDLATQLRTSGLAAITPLLQGLEAALTPKVHLYQQLHCKDPNPNSGWVEPIGTAGLVRLVGEALLSGRLHLQSREGYLAEVVFRRGEICGCTLNSPSSAVGPLALFHLFGYEWQKYSFIPCEIDMSNITLGDLPQLIETACQQNNILLNRLYQFGVQIDEVIVDNKALDAYLQKLPPFSLEVLIRLVEGEKAVLLAEKGLATPTMLKAMLHDLRRKAVIQPLSLRPVNPDSNPIHIGIGIEIGLSHQGRRRRWLVVLSASIVTALLTAGSYLFYHRVMLAPSAPTPSSFSTINENTAPAPPIDSRPTDSAARDSIKND